MTIWLYLLIGLVITGMVYEEVIETFQEKKCSLITIVSTLILMLFIWPFTLGVIIRAKL